jgi:polyribonucleotide nucleotidyltransferase
MIVGLKDTEAFKAEAISRTYSIGGKNITFESGKLALLADGSVVIRDEEGNYLLTTAGVSEKAKPGSDFFAMTVDFQEKYYAAGKIGGNRFMKREGRASENAILNSRLIDRPIRPMFPKGVLNEVQVISTIMSSSGLSDYGFYGVTGASLVLMLSGTTAFEGPVAGVRVFADESGKLGFDPKFSELKNAKLDLTVAGTLDAITMVESQAQQVDDETMLKAFEYAHSIIKDLCNAQLDFVAVYSAKYPLPASKIIMKEAHPDLYTKIKEVLTADKMQSLYGVSKLEFHDALHHLEDEVKAALGYTEDTEELKAVEIEEYVYKAVRETMRSGILGSEKRLDGRQLTQVRPIKVEAGLLPRVHGSALFQRGITQALSIATLGGPGDIMLIDDMFEQETKRYIHHYNFPPFSTGEIKGLRNPGRREIGHGRLAEKALEPVLPDYDKFPYFIRVVSETTTCNGSSSMASVCGSSLSLMDAGVPIKAMVAGVAMGLVYDDNTRKYKVLSDIQAQEDFLGDMDFKVAGTEKGITALQMDCKIKGLEMQVVRDVLSQAKGALEFISNEMRKVLEMPRPTLSQYAPSILSLTVPSEKIREVIGKGGEMIQKISKDFNVEIVIDDNGFVSVTAKNQEQGHNAVAFIKALVKDIEPGDLITGKAFRIIDGTGAIVDLGNGKSGMIHISKIAKERVNKIEDYIKVGDMVDVKVLTVDRENNRIGLERIQKDLSAIPETPKTSADMLMDIGL